MFKLLVILLLLSPFKCLAQYQGHVWCFGDSIQMRFDTIGVPSFSTCNTNNLEPCASIADSSGNLLLYLGFYGQSNRANVYNKHHQVIMNGDSILANYTASNGMTILPDPISINLYYVFHIGFPSVAQGNNHRFYYSVVDVDANGGNGEVLSANNTLVIPSDSINEKLACVRHGNGRDWWIAVHGKRNNVFHFYLLDPLGVTFSHSQSIGSTHSNNTLWGIYGGPGSMTFSKSGLKLLAVDVSGIIDVFEFDRCLGYLSNFIALDTSFQTSMYEWYLGSSISPNDELVYVSSAKRLFQFNLQSVNPLIPSGIFTLNYPGIEIGHHQIGPDDKIYITNAYWGGQPPYNNYDTTNKHLNVINFPDSVGSGCGFQPYAAHLYVGRMGKTWDGLPNIPNYNLRNIVGSVCDTVLTNIITNEESIIEIVPNPSTGKVEIVSKGKQFSFTELKIYDISGKLLISRILEDLLNSELDLEHLDVGIYLIQLRSGDTFITKKLVLLN